MTRAYLKDRFMRVGGLWARYWAEGERGSPLILIHGLGGYVENWWPDICKFGEQHRVYAVDLPGFGRSDKPSAWPYGLPAFVKFLRDFMAVLGLERASLAGHSLGGAVALQFTQTYPQMVERLVLVSSGGLGPEMGAMLRVASLPLLGELLNRPSLENSKLLMASIFYDRSRIELEDAQYDFELASQPGAGPAFLKTLRSVATLFGQKRALYAPIVKQLPGITQPTLVVWGREDRIVPLKHAEVARRIPNAQTLILDQCGHMPQFEHLERFDEAVQQFLADSPP